MPTKQQPGQAPCEVRLADPRIAQQQHRLQVQGVIARQAQRELASDVLQWRFEVGHLLDQPVDVRQRRRLDGKALTPELDHPGIRRAQRLVGAVAQVLQIIKRLLDPANVIDVLESGDRDRGFHRGGKRNDCVHRSILGSGPDRSNRARCAW